MQLTLCSSYFLGNLKSIHEKVFITAFLLLKYIGCIYYFKLRSMPILPDSFYPLSLVSVLFSTVCWGLKLRIVSTSIWLFSLIMSLVAKVDDFSCLLLPNSQTIYRPIRLRVMLHFPVWKYKDYSDWLKHNSNFSFSLNLPPITTL